MRLLLDTHALIWWVRGMPQLGREAAGAISDPAAEIWVSAISALEISTKVRLGKLPEGELLAMSFEEQIARENFIGLPVAVQHARLAGNLHIPHKDPFDRVLIAQAILEDLVLVSNERLFDGFGVSRLW